MSWEIRELVLRPLTRPSTVLPATYASPLYIAHPVGRAFTPVPSDGRAEQAEGRPAVTPTAPSGTAMPFTCGRRSGARGGSAQELQHGLRSLVGLGQHG